MQDHKQASIKKAVYSLIFSVILLVGAFLGLDNLDDSLLKNVSTESMASSSVPAEASADVAQPADEALKSSEGAETEEQATLAQGHSGSVVRLATWNLHDFFDCIDDSCQDEVLTPRQFAEKLDSLKAGLDEVQADIVGVCEVESETCLIELGKRAGYPYHLLVQGNDTARGINVGVLSRIPIKNYVSHAKDSFYGPNGGKKRRFSRDCLEVHFQHASKLTVLVNHFKSQRGKDKALNDSKRIAQAQRVKQIAASLKRYPVAIVGDLNVDPDSPSIRPLLKASDLIDVLAVIPTAKRVTFKTKRYSSALDYILVNKKLSACVIPNTVKIYASGKASLASDHRPVSVDLNLDKVAN